MTDITTEADRQTLFTPIALGSRVMRNRVMQLSTTNHLHQSGRISPASIAFYEARAKGGVGCVVTESLATDPTGLRGGVPAYDDETRPGFARLAEALHDRGALIIGQLNHGGRQHLTSDVPRLVGPSSLACP
jgi:2,4-dienoyl-CoA reductase-like NADH-dependent reductase (Old Yellow Enzyme family)